MKEVTLEWRNYKYFDYERRFAKIELETLLKTESAENNIGVSFPSSSFNKDRIKKLTYFSRITAPDGEQIVPDQVLLEKSALINGGERQSTRYSSHGLHEYRGKFNPQLVRSIGNILDLKENAYVLDPFSGSGTTLLESAHIGWNAIGIDRNPLAVRIANAKIQALKNIDSLLELYPAIVHHLCEHNDVLSNTNHIPESDLTKILGKGWVQELPSYDYLQKWFTLPVLAQIVHINRTINKLCLDHRCKNVLNIILSNHLREVSLQDPGDLRIRRRKDSKPNYPLLNPYIETLDNQLLRIKRASELLGVTDTEQKALLGDVCQFDILKSSIFPTQGVDAVICSPPYETALPYIDTQRLSLVLLGEIDNKEIQLTEKALIGAREISTTERRKIEELIQNPDGTLPKSVHDLCQEMLIAASLPGNGFRRINRPALSYRYFKRMAEFYRNLNTFVRSKGYIALVVGKNKTTLGGNEFLIDTPHLLAKIGEFEGFEIVDEIKMNTYQRYDLHKKNSITNETLIILRKG